MDVAGRLRGASRRTGAGIAALAVVAACGAVAIALQSALVEQSVHPAAYAGAAFVLLLSVVAGAVGRWMFRNGAEDVVRALENDPRSIVSVEYKQLRSYQLFRPDRHHLVFRFQSGRTTVSVRSSDVGHILNEVRARAPHAAVSQLERYGPW